jgi:hypothetical protein
MNSLKDLLVDKSFLSLDRQLRTFNVFDVLNLKEFEIRHTRFLAHMLDPNGSHGLGTAFLRNFLLHVCAQLPDGGSQLPGEIHQLDLELARVNSELTLDDRASGAAPAPAAEDAEDATASGRLDILLRLPRRNGDTISIAIENKINAREGNNQLARYRNWMDKKYGKNGSLLLYLTVTEEDVKAPWYGITYSNTVYPALDTTRETAGSTLGTGPALLIDHYMAALRDKVEAEAASADADRLAEELHRSYPHAKGMIAELRSHWENPLGNARLDAEWGLYSRYKATFDFLASYDTDEQTLVLRWFKRSWPDAVAAIQSGTRIIADDSVRTNMRFLPDYPRSELTTLARGFAAKSASGKKLAWTTGQHAVLFEIRSYPLPQEPDDRVTRYQWVLFLVVGPLDCIERTRFIRDLRANLASGLKDYRDVEVQPQSRRITQTFTSVLRLKLPAGSRAELGQQMTAPAFLKTLQRIAAETERTLKDAEPDETSGEA